MFEYAPYKDTGRTAAQRLLDLRKERAAAEQADPQQAEQPEAEDGTDEDVAAIDLDAVGDEEDAGDEPECDDAPNVKPLGPGDDATEEEIAAWRAEHGVPDDPDGYEPPTVEGIEWDADALGQIQEIAHQHNIPQQAMADALAAYAEQIRERQAAIKQRDRENAKAVRSEFSEAEISAIKSAAKAMPADLRRMLNTAILPDGTKLANQPDLLRMIASAYGTGGEHQAAPQRQDYRTMLQQELAEIDSLMRTNITEYHRTNWRGSNRSASDRRLEIMRQLDAPDPNPQQTRANLENEKHELLRLRTSDPQMFSFGNWRNTGRPAADRLAALQAGRG